jgi:AcrR family transcriptional regulator
MAARTESRLPLTRDRILRAALELADEGGIEAVTMRKLGQTLGFEAMSLYNHVANKDDLLVGLLDLVLAEADAPSPDDDWVTAIRTIASSVHKALRQHRWAAALFMSAAHVTPARLRYMDSLLGRLREAGFPPDTTYHAYHVLDGHIFGFSQWENSHAEAATKMPPEVMASFMELIPEAEYPYLYEHGRQHTTEGPHRAVSAFEFGLDLILDGLQKIHAGSPRVS